MIDIQSAIIAHQYPLDRLALSQIIHQQNTGIIITEITCLSELQSYLELHPDTELLLLDLALVHGQSLQLIQELHNNYPAIKTLTISHHEQNISEQLIRNLGVAGNLSSKDGCQTVTSALQRVAEGKNWFHATNYFANDSNATNRKVIRKLSRQEHRVMNKLVKGLMNKQIADELKISPNTAKAHVRSILRKLGLNNRTQVVLVHSQQPLNE